MKKYTKIHECGTFACVHKKFRQSCTLVCTSTRHHRSYNQISPLVSNLKSLFTKIFGKNQHCPDSKWSQPGFSINSILNFTIWTLAQNNQCNVRCSNGHKNDLPSDYKNSVLITSPAIEDYVQINDLPPDRAELCIDNKSGNWRLRTNKWSTFWLFRNSALKTSPVIEGYLQIYECSSELLKHVLNLQNVRYSVHCHWKIIQRLVVSNLSEFSTIM